jgi:DNA mismatch repair protein MSH2
VHTVDTCHVHKLLHENLSRLTLTVSILPKAIFNESNVRQDLQRVLDTDVHAVIPSSIESSQGIKQAVAALLEYTGIIREEAKYCVQEYSLEDYVRLDECVIGALDLCGRFITKKQKGTLFGVLNKCVSVHGQRVLMQWIRQPLLSVSKINERQDLVHVFLDLNVREALCSVMKHVPDFNKIVKKFARRKGTLEDVVCIYECVKTLPSVHEIIEEYEGEYKDVLVKVFGEAFEKCHVSMKPFMELVDTTVQIEEKDVKIKHDFDPELTSKLFK